MNWKQTIFRKLTSRKFWVALACVCAGLVLLFGYGESDAETTWGAVLTIGGSVAYMLAEGIPDALSVGKILGAAEEIFYELKDGKDDANDGDTSDTERGN